MRKWIFVLFLFGSLAFNGIARGTMMNGDLFDLVDSLICTGRYIDAANICKLVSKTAQNSQDQTKALLLEGTILGFGLGSPSAALECYEKILFLYPESPAAADALFHSAIH